MIIVADENIARAADALSQFGEVRLLPGREITRDRLYDADALVVRSITAVNRSLLHDTPVRFVGTATIGTDHIDSDYLNEEGIGFADAAGGGARSVAEYIVAALLTLRERGRVKITGEKLAVIGVGAIGSGVARFARSLGMEVLLYDPPRAAAEPEFISASLEDVFDCDVIAPSVPLTHDGSYPTHHLVNRDFLARCKPGMLLINTSRGGVVDSGALADALEEGRVADAVLDVWEGEPDVPTELLNRCSITTPHIAGYSQDGKLKGTEMMADALARHLGTQNAWSVRRALPPEAGRLDLGDLSPLDALRRAVRAAYDIEADSSALRQTFGLTDEERRRRFDLLRKTYPVRREFPAWHCTSRRQETRQLLKEIGFAVEGAGQA